MSKRQRKSRLRAQAAGDNVMQAASMSPQSIHPPSKNRKSNRWPAPLSRLLDQAVAIEERQRTKLMAAKRIREALEHLVLGEVDRG